MVSSIRGFVEAQALDEADQVGVIGDRHDLTAVDDHRLTDQSPLDALAGQQP